jgi:hypothetical protein
VVPVVLTSNAPGAARLRHVEGVDAPRVDASTFRQGWRVRTRLDALLADGRIDAATWQAAVEYRDAWARVLQAVGGSPQGFRVSGAGADVHYRLLGLLDTLTRLRAVEEALGSVAAPLCFRCVVEDRSWATTALLCHRHPETVRDWTALALRALAVAWAGRRRRGFDVSQDPRTPRRRVRAS